MKINNKKGIFLTCILLISVLFFIPISSDAVVQDELDPTNLQAYDDYGSESLLPYYVLYDTYVISGTGRMWLQTDNSWDTMDMMVMTVTNFNNFMDSLPYSTYASWNDAHVATLTFVTISPLTLVLVYYNDNSYTVDFDYIIDTGASDFPEFSGHSFEANGVTVEPGDYYYVYASDVGPSDQLSGFFENYMPTGDHIDFFICDSSDFSYWQSFESIPAGAHNIYYNYYWLTWEPFVPPYTDTWYMVHSAVDAADTVTFSVYVDLTDAPKSISVSSPTSSDILETDSSWWISWSSTGGISNVDIELWKGGSYVQDIVSSTSDDGSYLWSLPAVLTPGSDYTIKVIDSSDAGVYDYSDQFTIISSTSITVTVPTSSTSWEAGTSQTIYWSSTGSIDYVDIYLAQTTYDNLLGYIVYDAPNTGSYSWGIVDTLPTASDYLIVIYDAGDYDTYGASDQFTLTEPIVSDTITITSPISSTSWEAGTSQTIYWSSTGTIDYVDIYLAQTTSSNILGPIVYDTPNTGSFSWGILSDMDPASDYLIVIYDADNYDTYDVSDQFTLTEAITSDTITVTSPISSTNWDTGSSYTITWTWTGDFSFVTIGLVKGADAAGYIAENVANDGEFEWTVPYHLETGSDYWIYVRDASASYEASDATDYFTITKTVASSITITTPSASTVWTAGTINIIEWDSTGVDDVDIFIAKGTIDNILGYIVYDASNTGSYSWGIPDDMEAGTDYYIVICASADTTVVDTSDAFEIKEKETEGAIFFTSPTPVSNWNAGGSYTISFNYVGDPLGYVKIELYRDGSFYRTIDNSANGTVSYEWEVPDDLSTSSTYQIKVTSLDDANLWGLSEEFTITEIEETTTDGVPSFTYLYFILGISALVVYRRLRRKN